MQSSTWSQARVLGVRAEAQGCCVRCASYRQQMTKLVNGACPVCEQFEEED